MVAIKVLDKRYSGDDELARRFQREALAAGRLSGEAHTVTTYDVGVCEGRPFIVMEYLAGGSLADVLRATGAQPPAQALRWLEDAAAALDHAHAHGVVHRDVKPANLLLSGDGRLHVADFGVASATGAAPMTMAGTVLGTAGYLAPEETEGKPATPASDRYALGVVAFELLTGERPFRRDSVTAEVAAHGSAPIPAASRRDRKLPSSSRRGVRARARQGPRSAVRDLQRVRRCAAGRICVDDGYAHRPGGGDGAAAVRARAVRRRRRAPLRGRRSRGLVRRRPRAFDAESAGDDGGDPTDDGRRRPPRADAYTGRPPTSGADADRPRHGRDGCRKLRRRRPAARSRSVARRRPTSDRRAPCALHGSAGPPTRTRPQTEARARARARPAGRGDEGG